MDSLFKQISGSNTEGISEGISWEKGSMQKNDKEHCREIQEHWSAGYVHGTVEMPKPHVLCPHANSHGNGLPFLTARALPFEVKDRLYDSDSCSWFNVARHRNLAYVFRCSPSDVS